jgi:hypothetical protein
MSARPEQGVTVDAFAGLIGHPTILPGDNSMSTIEQYPHNGPHRGTFAEGKAMPDKYAGEDEVGTFAQGQADVDKNGADRHVGTFAEGEAMPDTYAGEDHVGSFADGQAQTA